MKVFSLKVWNFEIKLGSWGNRWCLANIQIVYGVLYLETNWIFEGIDIETKKHRFKSVKWRIRKRVHNKKAKLAINRGAYQLKNEDDIRG